MVVVGQRAVVGGVELGEVKVEKVVMERREVLGHPRSQLPEVGSVIPLLVARLQQDHPSLILLQHNGDALVRRHHDVDDVINLIPLVTLVFHPDVFFGNHALELLLVGGVGLEVRLLKLDNNLVLNRRVELRKDIVFGSGCRDVVCLAQNPAHDHIKEGVLAYALLALNHDTHESLLGGLLDDVSQPLDEIVNHPFLVIRNQTKHLVEGREVSTLLRNVGESREGVELVVGNIHLRLEDDAFVFLDVGVGKPELEEGRSIGEDVVLLVLEEVVLRLQLKLVVLAKLDTPERGGMANLEEGRPLPTRLLKLTLPFGILVVRPARPLQRSRHRLDGEIDAIPRLTEDLLLHFPKQHLRKLCLTLTLPNQSAIVNEDIHPPTPCLQRPSHRHQTLPLFGLIHPRHRLPRTIGVLRQPLDLIGIHRQDVAPNAVGFLTQFPNEWRQSFG